MAMSINSYLKNNPPPAYDGTASELAQARARSYWEVLIPRISTITCGTWVDRPTIISYVRK